MIKTYYNLAKPGIIYGNAITTAAGFFLASKGLINWWLFFATLVGLSLIIASGCVFNNYIDSDIDERMERTKNRPLVTGLISNRNAIIYAILLGLLGAGILALYTNLLATIIALIGFFVYVVLYGYEKRRSIYGTLVGSIAGGVPPVVGYCAVTNNLDLGAIILFIILVTWQMPHFYAIAIYRFNDYSLASIPVLPIKKGIYVTKINMLCYVVAFIGATTLLTALGFTGYVYLVVALLLGFSWLWLCIKGFNPQDSKLWARKMFRFSLVVLLVFSIMVSIGGIISV